MDINKSIEATNDDVSQTKALSPSKILTLTTDTLIYSVIPFLGPLDIIMLQSTCKYYHTLIRGHDEEIWQLRCFCLWTGPIPKHDGVVIDDEVMRKGATEDFFDGQRLVSSYMNNNDENYSIPSGHLQPVRHALAFVRFIREFTEHRAYERRQRLLVAGYDIRNDIMRLLLVGTTSTDQQGDISISECSDGFANQGPSDENFVANSRNCHSNGEEGSKLQKCEGKYDSYALSYPSSGEESTNNSDDEINVKQHKEPELASLGLEQCGSRSTSIKSKENDRNKALVNTHPITKKTLRKFASINKSSVTLVQREHANKALKYPKLFEKEQKQLMDLKKQSDQQDARLVNFLLQQENKRKSGSGHPTATGEAGDGISTSTGVLHSDCGGGSLLPKEDDWYSRPREMSGSISSDQSDITLWSTSNGSLEMELNHEYQKLLLSEQREQQELDEMMKKLQIVRDNRRSRNWLLEKESRRQRHIKKTADELLEDDPIFYTDILCTEQKADDMTPEDVWRILEKEASTSEINVRFYSNAGGASGSSSSTFVDTPRINDSSTPGFGKLLKEYNNQRSVSPTLRWADLSSTTQRLLAQQSRSMYPYNNNTKSCDPQKAKSSQQSSIVSVSLQSLASSNPSGVTIEVKAAAHAIIGKHIPSHIRPCDLRKTSSKPTPTTHHTNEISQPVSDFRQVATEKEKDIYKIQKNEASVTHGDKEDSLYYSSSSSEASVMAFQAKYLGTSGTESEGDELHSISSSSESSISSSTDDDNGFLLTGIPSESSRQLMTNWQCSFLNNLSEPCPILNENCFASSEILNPLSDDEVHSIVHGIETAKNKEKCTDNPVKSALKKRILVDVITRKRSGGIRFDQPPLTKEIVDAADRVGEARAAKKLPGSPIHKMSLSQDYSKRNLSTSNARDNPHAPTTGRRTSVTTDQTTAGSPILKEWLINATEALPVSNALRSFLVQRRLQQGTKDVMSTSVKNKSVVMRLNFPVGEEQSTLMDTCDEGEEGRACHDSNQKNGDSSKCNDCSTKYKGDSGTQDIKSVNSCICEDATQTGIVKLNTGSQTINNHFCKASNLPPCVRGDETNLHHYVNTNEFDDNVEDKESQEDGKDDDDSYLPISYKSMRQAAKQVGPWKYAFISSLKDANHGLPEGEAKDKSSARLGNGDNILSKEELLQINWGVEFKQQRRPVNFSLSSSTSILTTSPPTPFSNTTLTISFDTDGLARSDALPPMNFKLLQHGLELVIGGLPKLVVRKGPPAPPAPSTQISPSSSSSSFSVHVSHKSASMATERISLANTYFPIWRLIIFDRYRFFLSCQRCRGINEGSKKGDRIESDIAKKNDDGEKTHMMKDSLGIVDINPSSVTTIPDSASMILTDQPNQSMLSSNHDHSFSLQPFHDYWTWHITNSFVVIQPIDIPSPEYVKLLLEI